MAATTASVPAAVEAWQTALLVAANPALPPTERVTATWPLTGLDAALAAMGLYAIVVVVGIVMRRNGAKEGQGLLSPTYDSAVKRVQVLYNLAQVSLCAFMIYKAVTAALADNYTLVCNDFTPHKTRMAEAVYVFYLSKILDFVDTIFIVLRGKWNQFSFLHIYHHFSIFFVYWVNVNAGYDGDIYYTVIANSFVHLVMYWYYFQASLFSRPWWGRYVTQLQMIQFVTMMSQAVYILTQGCAFPHNITIFYLVYIASLFGLFMSFYLRKYTSSKAKKSA